MNKNYLFFCFMASIRITLGRVICHYLPKGLDKCSKAIDIQRDGSSVCTNLAMTKSLNRPLDSTLQTGYMSVTCERSSCFDSIGAGIQSDKATGIATEVAASRRTAEEEVAIEKVARAGTSADLRSSHWKFFGESVNQDLKVDEVVEKLESGQLWVVNSRRRNGLIVLREFHAEFAGPGAAVGGDLDAEDIVGVIPIGNLSLLSPDSHEAHQNAIKIRLQWIRLTQNFTDQPCPDDRARMILEQFKTYFDQDTVDLVPDRAFAMLVGVLPRTIRRVRDGFVW